MRPYVVGLTGGIASGKTLVADQFIALGVPLLDADLVSREVVQPGEPALAEIAETFGAAVIQADGTLDRRRLREIVFGDPAALKQLEAITHPRMRARIRRWAEAQTTPYCILSAAILLESGMHALVRRVLVVDVPEAVQLARLLSRDGISEVLARQMMAAQSPRTERLQRADDVLDNTGTPEATAHQVAALHEQYLKQAADASAEAPGN
jgi:dephospho-CoA kinase